MELLTVVPTKELKRVRDEYIEKYLKPLLEVHKNETLETEEA
jgi:V/A-type H+-transporting ATPase subunit B